MFSHLRGRTYPTGELVCCGRRGSAATGQGGLGRRDARGFPAARSASRSADPARRASSSVTQAISSSSPQSPWRSRLSSRSASAMKKRASKRLCRDGGVTARAMNRSASRSAAAPWARNSRHGPAPGRGGAGLASNNPASSNVSRTAVRARALARGSAMWSFPGARRRRAATAWRAARGSRFDRFARLETPICPA